MTGTVKQKITIEFWGLDNNQVEKILGILKGIEVVDTTTEMDDDTEVEHIVVEGVETARYFYTPATMYASNGDPGDPEYYEDELQWDSTSIEQEINKWVTEYAYDTLYVDWFVCVSEPEQIEDCGREDW